MYRGNSKLLRVTVFAAFVFLLGPLLIVLGAAFSDTEYLTFPPQGLSVRWFVNVATSPSFMQAFLTSLELAFLSTFLGLVIGIPAAYALARYRRTLPKLIGSVFVLPILVPEIVIGFSLLNAISAGRNLPIFPILLMGHTVLVLPYVVRVVGASLNTFDFAVEEAALSLGCPPLKTFFSVVLPNMRAGVIAAFILAAITSLNDVSTSLFLIGPGVATLPIHMLTYVETSFDPSIAAVSVVLMALTVVVMLIVEHTLGLTQAFK